MNLSTSNTKIVAPPTVTSIGIGENSPDINEAVDGTLIRFRKDGYFYSVYSEDKNNKDKAIEIATYIIKNN